MYESQFALNKARLRETLVLEDLTQNKKSWRKKINTYTKQFNPRRQSFTVPRNIVNCLVHVSLRRAKWAPYNAMGSNFSHNSLLISNLSILTPGKVRMRRIGLFRLKIDNISGNTFCICCCHHQASPFHCQPVHLYCSWSKKYFGSQAKGITTPSQELSSV